MAKYLIKDIKEYSDELADLFLDYDGSDILNDNNDYIEDKDGNCLIELNELIWNTADNNFIYYCEADDFLRDYDIWDEMKEYKAMYGDTPHNQCALACFVYDREIRNELYEALNHIDEYEPEGDENE